MHSSKTLLLALALGLSLGGCNEKSSEPAEAGKTSDASQQKSMGHGEASGHDAHGHGAAVPAPAAVPGEKGQVYFAFPHDGSKVFETFDVAFAAKDLQVVPAGTEPDNRGMGHHHLIIDDKAVPAGTVVPADATHIHYGKGQTQAQITLTPGKHSLTMQFADGAHRSYGPQRSATMNVEVVKNPAKKAVRFVSPVDGAKVKNPVKLAFALDGMTVRPAGEDVMDKTSGHHHIVVDGGPIALGQPVPKDEKNIHYGGGQVEAELTLPEGKHTLTLQLADGAHLSYGKGMSTTITVMVEK